MAIDYQPEGSIVVITINRENAMNAIDAEHNDALSEAFVKFDSDPHLRVAVLTGAGQRAFSAGFDLRVSVPEFRRRALLGEDPPWQLGGLTVPGRTRKPILAAVNGHALAGGCELALACDLRHCSSSATFGLPETRLGVVPGAGGSVRLPREVPLGMAAEMILTGDPIGADTALRIGLVNKVWEPEKLLPGVKELAHRIASRAPIAIAAARATLFGTVERTDDAAMRSEHERFVAATRSDEAEEGFRAQAERDPLA